MVVLESVNRGLEHPARPVARSVTGAATTRVMLRRARMRMSSAEMGAQTVCRMKPRRVETDTTPPQDAPSRTSVASASTAVMSVEFLLGCSRTRIRGRIRPGLDAASGLNLRVHWLKSYLTWTSGSMAVMMLE